MVSTIQEMTACVHVCCNSIREEPGSCTIYMHVCDLHSYIYMYAGNSTMYMYVHMYSTLSNVNMFVYMYIA